MLKDLFKRNLITLDANVNSKDEVLDLLIDSLDREGILTNKSEFKKAIIKREASSPTGLEEGLAIPHGKSEAVKKPMVAVARLKNPLKEWESVDEDNEVNLVFMIAMPIGDSGSTHIDVLTKLTTAFMNDSFITKLQNTKTADEFLATVLKADVDNSANNQNIINGDKNIIAVTACPTGIAHTFMAAEKIKNYCESKGYSCKVETQGSDGVKNTLTASDINKADAIILAVDVPIQDEERFTNQNVVKLGTQALLKNVEKVVEEALKLEKGENYVDDTTKDTNPILKHVMTGISYMIPILVFAGLLLAVGNIAAEILGKESQLYQNIFADFGKIGFMSMKFVYPFFAGYLAFSIAGKPALVPGFIGGVMTDEVYKRFLNVDGFVPSGFFGALAIGFSIGYLIKFLNDKISVKESLTTIKTMLIVPLIAGLFVTLAMIHVINPIFGALNLAIGVFFESAGKSGAGIYNTLIAAGTAFDLGGPVNKAAGAVAIGLNNDGVFDLTARTLAIIIPPIGIGIAVNIDRFMKKNIFTSEERTLGSTSFILGCCGISEGAIPFLLKHPIMIIINIIGAITGALVAVFLGATQTLPLPAIWGWPLVKSTNTPIGIPTYVWGPLTYIIGIAVGAGVIAMLTILILGRKAKKN